MNHRTWYPPATPVRFPNRFPWLRTLGGLILGVLLIAIIALGTAALIGRLEARLLIPSAAEDAAYLQGMQAGALMCRAKP